MNEPKENWKIIGRGFAGWHAKSEICSSSGGRLLPYYYREIPCQGYLAEAEEGCFVYDASHLEPTKAGDEFEKWIISGPMVELKLKPGEYSKVDPSAAGFSGFDFVALDIWVAELIRRVPGVKYGYVNVGNIEWVVS